MDSHVTRRISTAKIPGGNDGVFELQALSGIGKFRWRQE
jgi:hypothetical protein